MNGARAQSPIWTLLGRDKGAQVRSMFERIAPSYDRVNAVMTLSADQRWRSSAVELLELHEGDTALDLCCGTGDFVKCLRQRVGSLGRIVGLDFAAPMLEIARRKPGAEALYLGGDAQSIPCASESFDAVTVGWGIRNVSDIDRVHREIVRVLKPGGRFVSVDTALPVNRFVRACSRLVCRAVVTVLGALAGNVAAYRYLHESTASFKSREELTRSMRLAGFQTTGHVDRLFGNICIHWGRKP